MAGFAILFPLLGVTLQESISLIICSAFGIGLGLGMKEHEQISGGGIRTFEELRWSWRRSLNGVGVGLLLSGFIIGVELFMERELALSQEWWNSAIRGALIPVVSFGFILGLSGTRISVKTIPGQGIWLSLRNAALVGVVVTILTGLALGLSNSPGETILSQAQAPSASFFKTTVRLSVATGLILALYFGGVTALNHGLIRLFVWQEGGLPLNLTRFFAHAVRLNFMRRVGGGYIFIHRLLQDYFRTCTATSPACPTHERPDRS